MGKKTESDIELTKPDIEIEGSDKQLKSDDSKHLPAEIKSQELVTKKSDVSVADPLKGYLKNIARYKLLTPEQEKELTTALYETGDIEIAKKLVLANLRLVVKIAMEYRHSYKNVMDLIQEGNIGLMKAVSKFDPFKGTKLSYYSSWWIRSYILKFIIDNFRLVKIGTTQDQKKLFYNLVREKQRLEAQGITPSPQLISEKLNVSEKAVIEMDQRLSSEGNEFSIDTPMKGVDGSGGSMFHDIMASEEPDLEDSVGHKFDMEILNDHLKDFVETLKERDKEIFQKRLLEDFPPTLQSIADEYGVSRERIRQIEARLLEKLKVYMGQYLR
jgi:RNA polymerase sigma-32 factor